MALGIGEPRKGNEHAVGMGPHQREAIPRDAPPHDVTRLLTQWRGGDDQALEELVSLVHGELRRSAGRRLDHERTGETLQTDLVREAFLRLIGQRQVDWTNRARLFGITAQMMRRILTDHARRHASGNHGGGGQLAFAAIPDIAARSDADIIAVDEALTELEEVDEELAKIVELRFFGGLQQNAIAAVLGVSSPAVGRRLRIASAWLDRRLSRRGSGDRDPP